MAEGVHTLVSALALGIVISGVFANVFGLITNLQSRFHFPATSDARRLIIVGLLLLAAPHLLFCAARRAFREGALAPAHTFSVFGLCSVWSLGAGFLVLLLL
jgi:uncharacterized membrane protein YidH (DUF202 family)